MTPPVITNCPGDFTQTVSYGETLSPVTWDEPTASDESGNASLSSDYRSGDSFDAGVSTTVTYTAVDNSGNEATCSFVITIVINGKFRFNESRFKEWT